jgi:hypothetical protein
MEFANPISRSTIMATSRLLSIIGAGILVLSTSLSPAQAGNIYITGHDPDFHAQGQVSGQTQLRVGLNFVTEGTFDDGGQKFLWVESRLAPPSGFQLGELGLGTIGLTLGVNYDRANAAELAGVDFSAYSAIVVASSFGGMLTKAEINALIARKDAIKTFVNAGGGVFAMAECFPASGFCASDNVDAATALFGFLPVSVTSVATAAPYKVTAFGASLGLTDADVSDCCTHNSFGTIAGLTIVDTDNNDVPTTLAGDVRIGDDGFVPIVPAPATLVLLAIGVVAAGLSRRRISR